VAGGSWTAAGDLPLRECPRAAFEGGEPFTGIDEVCIVTRWAPEVLAPQREAGLSGQDARTITVPAGVARLPGITQIVEHRTPELGVVGPRSAVEVVRADLDPDVIDDAHLRVDVDGCPRSVHEVVHGHPSSARPA
jgi:hypothetical protein